MHIARRIGVGPGDIGGECFHKRDREIAGPRRGLGKGAEIEQISALQAVAIGATALQGIAPTIASARASAASKSSMCCRYVASSQTARMAALDSIGASRGDREVLMMRAT